MSLRAIIVLLATVAAMAGTARLGLWQLDRAAQKTSIQDETDQRQAMAPLRQSELARQADQLPAQLHREVELEGEWLERHTVFLDNRQMSGQTGFIVLTPLRLADGSAVLVERGWIARDFIDRTRVTAPPAEPGRVAVRGRIAPHPSRLFEFEGAASGAIRQNVDLAAFASETGLDLRPLSILQTLPASNALRRDWPRTAAGVHKNYGYAFQWFALCALILALYVWYQILRPRRRRP